MRPNRRGVVGQWFALLGAVIAIGVIVVLIVTWPGHGNGSASKAGTDPAAAKQAGKAAAQGVGAIQP